MPNRDSHFESGIFFVTQTHQLEPGRISRPGSFFILPIPLQLWKGILFVA